MPNSIGGLRVLRKLDLSSTWPHRRLEIVLVGLGIVVASLLGPAVRSRGAEVLGWLAIPFAGLLLLIQPVLGMLLVVMTIPVENVVMYGGEVTATRILGMVVFGLWLSRKLVFRESWQPILSTRFFKATILLLAFAFASILWARYPADVYSSLFQLFRLLLLSLSVIDLVDSWDRADWLVKVLVIAGMVAAMLAIHQYVVGDLRGFWGRAGDDIAGGVNNTAAILVTIVPFAFYLLRAQEGRLWRLLGLAYLSVVSAAVALTFSRWASIVLPLVLLAEYRETIKRRTGRGWLILLTGLAVIAAVAVIPQDVLLKRAQTIWPYLQSTISGSDYEETFSSHGLFFRVGVVIFLDHPLLGIGYNNYYRRFFEYQFHVSSIDRVLLGQRSPHGSYIGFLADLGVLGLALWLGILSLAWRNLTAARSILARKKASPQFLLVQAVIYSFLVQIGYGWLANHHKEKLLWVLLALSVAIRHLTDQSERPHLPVAKIKTTSRVSSFAEGGR